MNDTLTLKSINFVNGTINLPGSKSISNRALLLSAIAEGTTNLNNLLISDDTRYMLDALKLFGIKISIKKDGTECTIVGKGKSLYLDKKISLFLGNAGTALRPLVAILSLRSNNIVVTGEKRMTERPIKHLVETLKQGGAIINYLAQQNYPPIHILGGFHGGELTVKGAISSQFLSALLIATPLAKCNSKITVKGKLVSKPYIDITLKLISLFGVKIINKSYKYFYIQGNQKYVSPGQYLIEGDATSASYFLAAAAIKGGSVCVTGIGINSIQGDIQFSQILKKMGAKITMGENFISCTRGELKGIDLDMNHIPDAAMTIAIVALFSKGRTIIRNIYNWRVKETDRLYAMSTELKKIGASVIEGRDFICIYPLQKFRYASINTYNDHRIAMCFSLVALSNINITLLNPTCVNKTFPNYFELFKNISH